jgi:hypothetical protein
MRALFSGRQTIVAMNMAAHRNSQIRAVAVSIPPQ